MIRVGDKLRFRKKLDDQLFAHGEPVEVIDVENNSCARGQTITVEVWEPFLYFGQDPHKIQFSFQSNYFAREFEQPGAPSWFDRLLNKIFGTPTERAIKKVNSL